MAAKTRRNFSKEFRADAVRMCRAGAGSVAEVAAHLGISKTSLYRWAQAAERAERKVERAPEADAAENERLRRENEQLRMERDFLKKAAAFFAKSQS